MNTKNHLHINFGIHNRYIEIPGVGRDDLLTWIHSLDFKVGVEVGVASGDYSKILLEANPQMKLYGVDPWVKYPGYNDYRLKATFEKMYNRTITQTRNYDNYKIIRKFSVEAAKDFEDESVDFVYLDGNHSGKSVLEDLETWFPKMRAGGIMAGHDFSGRFPDLRRAVRSFCKENNKQLFVLGLESNQFKLKRDSARSWMFLV